MIKAEKQATWEKKSTEYGPELKLFQVRYDWLINPRNKKLLKRLILESENWVNIVARTAKNKIVTVKQYRFGVEKFTLEIPGGLIDENESSKEAAIRELKEETGYTSKNWQFLGVVQPNPAFQNNLCYHWYAENAQKTDEPDLDDGEDIVVANLSLSEIKDAIQQGDFLHVLALSALSRVFDLRSMIDLDNIERKCGIVNLG
jgi:ADP-ribose pyrophosphatase